MDNIQITKVLEITSVIMCEREMGNGAASLLMQRLKDRNAEYRDLYYRPTLQVRDSSLKKKEKRWDLSYGTVFYSCKIWYSRQTP